MKGLFAALALTLAAAPASAQSVGECEWISRAANIVEPWEAHSRTFANGAVRLALLDTIEPGAVPFHLLLLSPPYDELGGRTCKVISFEPGIGFTNIVWDELQARYDPAVGLVFHAPVEIMVGDGASPAMRGLAVTLNQATGDVQAELLTEPPAWVE